jgi:hypothetical protein
MIQDKRKKRKLYSLKQVRPSPAHSIDKKYLSSRPIFYSGTSNRTLPNQVRDGFILSAMEDLQVINTVNGAQMESASGDTVFILIP